jgi:hypothetical protein
VGLFRRKQETLNEHLLREAGLDPAQSLGEPVASTEPRREPEPPSKPPQPLPFSTDGRRHDRWILGPKEWDAALTVRAPALSGDRIEFTTIPNGDVIVSEESGDADLAPLADALEKHVSPPYRAVGTRQDGDLWGVGAKRIEVAQIPLPEGDELELSHSWDDSELRVDGEPSHAPVPPELEQLGEQVGRDYCVAARRIDGDFWEVKVSPL